MFQMPEKSNEENKNKNEKNKDSNHIPNSSNSKIIMNNSSNNSINDNENRNNLINNQELSNINKEMEMIDTNIRAVHILTKLYLQDFMMKNKGYILNVASVAGFFSGPLMATYYATKNYVVSLTGAVYEELKRRGSDVKISAFCPGPVDTEFNTVAHVKFASAPIDSKTAAALAVDGVMRGKLYNIPTVKIKSLKFIKRLVPDKTITHFCYTFQKKKR